LNAFSVSRNLKTTGFPTYEYGNLNMTTEKSTQTNQEVKDNYREIYHNKF